LLVCQKKLRTSCDLPPCLRKPTCILSMAGVHMTAMWVQGEEEETQQKPVWLQEDGQEVGSPTAANAGQLHLEGPTPTQPMDPQGAADFIGLDDDAPGEESRKHHLVVLHQNDMPAGDSLKPTTKGNWNRMSMVSPSNSSVMTMQLP